MAISRKVTDFLERSSWIRRMFEEGERLRKVHGAENIFDFTLGNPVDEPPAAFQKEFLRLAQNPRPGMHRYMNNAGYEETRKAVAEVLAESSGKPVNARHVIMTCGAGGAINVVLKTLLNPGEEVIILIPFFAEYSFYIDNHGGMPREVQTDPETFQLDIRAIAEAIGENTSAIILNSPNNPTGAVYPRESLEELGRMLSRKEKEMGRPIYLISDEPYRRLTYDGIEVPDIFSCVKNSVIVNSHSKDLALPGERIGYIAVNPDMEEVGRFLEGAIFCNRVLGFVNAPALMQRLVTGLQRESVDIETYRRKRNLLYDRLTSLGFDMIRPGGGFYLFPRSPIADDVEFVRLAQKYNILVVPGAGFGAPGHFRIAYCIEEDVIRRSLPAWEKLAEDLQISSE